MANYCNFWKDIPLSLLETPVRPRGYPALRASDSGLTSYRSGAVEPRHLRG